MKLLSLTFFILISFVTPQKTAQDYLNDLEIGALLVRLESGAKKIEALNQQGHVERAKEVKAEIQTQQERWKLAYSTHYSIGKVYFFQDSDSRKIINKDFKGVLEDSAGNLVDFNGPFLVVSEETTDNFKLNGLIIRDQELNKVDVKKFPDFVPKYSGFLNLNTRSEVEMVIALNKKLAKIKK